MNNRSPIGIKRLLHISQKLGIKFETKFGETKVSESLPLYLTKTEERIIEVMKPLTEKEIKMI